MKREGERERHMYYYPAGEGPQRAFLQRQTPRGPAVSQSRPPPVTPSGRSALSRARGAPGGGSSSRIQPNFASVCFPLCHGEALAEL